MLWRFYCCVFVIRVEFDVSCFLDVGVELCVF